MSKFKSLKSKYNFIIKQTLERNKKILIDSFMEYYGEEYRSIIEERYNAISFIYYINWDTIECVIEDFLPYVENPEKYDAFIQFFHCRDKQKSFWEKIFKSVLPSHFVGTTDVSVLTDYKILSHLLSFLDSPDPISYCDEGETKTYSIVLFQILALCSKTIIHEINHALTRDVLVHEMENGIDVNSIFKVGLSIDVNHLYTKEILLEELLNEKASVDIEKIFISKGGDLSSFCFDIPIVYTYDYNLYLVDAFYEEFKEYIKVARISLNKNALVARVGKENYQRFEELVNTYFTDDIDAISEKKDEAIQRINELMEQMKKHVELTLQNSAEEQNYCEQLRNAGYHVRELNHFDNDDMPISRKREK